MGSVLASADIDICCQAISVYVAPDFQRIGGRPPVPAWGRCKCGPSPGNLFESTLGVRGSAILGR